MLLKARERQDTAEAENASWNKRLVVELFLRDKGNCQRENVQIDDNTTIQPNH